MSNFIELPGGTVVDADDLVDLYFDKKRDSWISNTVDGKMWTWGGEKTASVLRKAMLARDRGEPMPRSFTCEYCGAHNEA
jgi:hypothetical protein